MPNKDTPPSPFSQAAEIHGLETSTATGVIKLRVYAQARPGDTRGRPPLTPAAPQSGLTPSEQLQGTLCREGPQVGMASLLPQLRDFTQTRQPTTIHHDFVDFILCFKHSSQSNAESQCFIHGSSTKNCPRSQHPCGLHHSTHRAGKAKDTFLSQGINSSKSKVSWVRKLQSRLHKQILHIRASPRLS